jgi:chromosome segregation ATPase
MMGKFSTEGLLRFPNSPAFAIARDDKATAVDLVYQAANLVRDLQNRADENERYAQTIAEKAVGKLSAAAERIRKLEAEQRAAQDKIDKANVMFRETAEAIKLEQSRARAVEEQVRQLELRVRNAEARASESENAVAQAEDAIRTHLLGHGAAA